MKEKLDLLSKFLPEIHDVEEGMDESDTAMLHRAFDSIENEEDMVRFIDEYKDMQKDLGEDDHSALNNILNAAKTHSDATYQKWSAIIEKVQSS